MASQSLSDAVYLACPDPRGTKAEFWKDFVSTPADASLVLDHYIKALMPNAGDGSVVIVTGHSDTKQFHVMIKSDMPTEPVNVVTQEFYWDWASSESAEGLALLDAKVATCIENCQRALAEAKPPKTFSDFVYERWHRDNRRMDKEEFWKQWIAVATRNPQMFSDALTIFVPEGMNGAVAMDKDKQVMVFVLHTVRSTMPVIRETSSFDIGFLQLAGTEAMALIDSGLAQIIKRAAQK